MWLHAWILGNRCGFCYTIPMLGATKMALAATAAQRQRHLPSGVTARRDGRRLRLSQPEPVADSQANQEQEDVPENAMRAL